VFRVLGFRVLQVNTVSTRLECMIFKFKALKPSTLSTRVLILPTRTAYHVLPFAIDERLAIILRDDLNGRAVGIGIDNVIHTSSVAVGEGRTLYTGAVEDNVSTARWTFARAWVNAHTHVRLGS
jgi:hypothetical protein